MTIDRPFKLVVDYGGRVRGPRTRSFATEDEALRALRALDPERVRPWAHVAIVGRGVIHRGSDAGEEA